MFDSVIAYVIYVITMNQFMLCEIHDRIDLYRHSVEPSREQQLARLTRARQQYERICSVIRRDRINNMINDVADPTALNDSITTILVRDYFREREIGHDPATCAIM